MKKTIAIVLTLILSSFTFLTYTSADLKEETCNQTAGTIEELEQSVKNVCAVVESAKAEAFDKNDKISDNKLNALSQKCNKTCERIEWYNFCFREWQKEEDLNWFTCRFLTDYMDLKESFKLKKIVDGLVDLGVVPGNEQEIL